MARDFSIGSRNNILQQIDTFVVALAVSPKGMIVYRPRFCWLVRDVLVGAPKPIIQGNASRREPAVLVGQDLGSSPV